MRQGYDRDLATDIIGEIWNIGYSDDIFNTIEDIFEDIINDYEPDDGDDENTLDELILSSSDWYISQYYDTQWKIFEYYNYRSIDSANWEDTLSELYEDLSSAIKTYLNRID